MKKKVMKTKATKAAAPATKKVMKTVTRKGGVKGKTELYTYVKPSIKKWVTAQAKKQGMTASLFVEKQLINAQKQARF